MIAEATKRVAKKGGSVQFASWSSSASVRQPASLSRRQKMDCSWALTRDKITLGLLEGGDGLLSGHAGLGNEDIDVLLVGLLSLGADKRGGLVIVATGDTLELGKAGRKKRRGK